jgi:hypothetical protein
MAAKGLHSQLKEEGNYAFYESWLNMRRRCDGRANEDINRRYHQSGITYTPEWNNFDNFYEDMFSTYSSGLTLERIDNLAGYSLKNCRWATYKEQANNRKTNRLITINNITKTLAQWIDTTSLKPSTVRQRYYVYKWPIEKALGLGG